MPLMHCVHYYSEKRNVFSDRPKTAAVCDGPRTFLGSEFQNIGPAAEKARRPYVVSRWDGITSWWPAAERRCCLEAVVETGTKHAARYRGAEPYRHRRVITKLGYLSTFTTKLILHLQDLCWEMFGHAAVNFNGCMSFLQPWQYAVRQRTPAPGMVWYSSV